MYPRNESDKFLLRASFSAVALFAALLSGGCGVPYLATVSVTPGSASVALGDATQFKVVANYSDGSKKDVTASAVWMTLDNKVATISSTGLATSSGTGTATIVAKVSGMSGTASLTVAKAALTGIAITAPAGPLAAGLSAQLHATGTYTDKSTADVTDSVIWTVAQPAVLTVSAAGLAVAQAAGNTQVSASLSGFNASAQITVSPAALASIAVQGKSAALPLGTSEQLSAAGTYTDGTIADLTSKVTWASSAPAVLNINATGMAATKSVGAASVTATLAGTSGAAVLTVSPAALVSIAVAASHPSLPLGTSEQLAATGTYTDGSTKDITASATWASASPAILAVNSSGTVVAKSLGSGGVSATASNITGSATLNVLAANLVAINVSASGATLPVGDTLQLSAVGAFSDGSTQDLTGSATWTTSSPTVLSFRGSGLVAGLSVGPAVVSATAGGITGVGNLTVSAPALASISLAPAGPTVPLGGTLQLAVTGTYSDGSQQDVTSQITWNVDTPSIAAISPTGLVTGLQVGATGIEASLNGVQTSDTLTVQPILAVAYFSAASSADSTIRITNPAITGQDLCALIYVFDQDQQMSECCGCLVSQDGLLTLSLRKNLLSNPLTGVPSTAGTVVVIPAAQASSGGCNASSLTPAGSLIAWSTRLPASPSAQSSTVDETFSNSPLDPNSAAAIQAQCSFVQKLGSGQGLCGCGSSQY